MRQTLVAAGLAALLGAGAPAPAASDQTGAAAPQPSLGDVVPDFEAYSVDGTRQQVSFPKGSRTVLLFFLSSCPTCHRMIPEWNRAWQRRPAGLRVIGVLMDQEPPGFFLSNPVAFPVVRSPGREFLRSVKVSRAPLMLRVGSEGKVEDVALGMADPIRVGEVFRP